MSEAALVVTGATGFVGRALLAAYAESNPAQQLVALVRQPGRLAGVVGVEARAFDLLEPESAAPLLEDAVVVHLAAYVPADHADPSEAGPCQRVNAQGTLDLLELCRRVGTRRFVHVSSANVYEPPAEPDRPIPEDAPLFPSRHSPYYLASKLVGEIYAEHHRQVHGLAGCTLRLSSVYGPGMAGGAVDVLARRIAGGMPVELEDGGRYGTDLVWVGDVTRAILAAACRDEVQGTLNVGSGQRTTLRVLADALVRATGADPALVGCRPPGPGPGGGFPALDVDRARQTLGYRPTPLADGVARLLDGLDAKRRP